MCIAVPGVAEICNVVGAVGTDMGVNRDRSIQAGGDVVVEAAGDVVVDGAEDVFVDDRAGCRSVSVSEAGDVYVEDTGDHPSVYEDEVVDGGGNVRISGAEDVRVREGALSGELRVNSAEDVYLATPEDATIETVDDVFLESDAVGRERVTVRGAHDVHFESDSVRGDLRVDDPEHVKLEGDPARSVEEDADGGTRFGAPDAVTLENVEDVLLSDGAVDGEVAIVDADAVDEDDDGWLF
jgi:hypothetical protein